MSKTISFNDIAAPINKPETNDNNVPSINFEVLKLSPLDKKLEIVDIEVIKGIITIANTKNQRITFLV